MESMFTCKRAIPTDENTLRSDPSTMESAVKIGDDDQEHGAAVEGGGDISGTDENLHIEHSVDKTYNDHMTTAASTPAKPKVYVGIDLSWKFYFAVFFIFWIPFAALDIAYRVTLALSQGGYCSSPYDTNCFPFVDPNVPCREWDWTCAISEGSRAFSYTATIWGIFVACLYIIAVFLAHHTLKTLSYNRYRIAHVQLGLQVPPRIFIMVLYILVCIFRSAIKSEDCDADIACQLLFGLLQIPVAVLVCTTCYVNSPVVPGDSEIKLHWWLQDYAWIESDVSARLSARPFTGEPCFCFETALKCNYYSMLIYYIEEIESEQFTKEIAMGLYGTCIAKWMGDIFTISKMPKK